MRDFPVFNKLFDSEDIPTEMHTPVYFEYLQTDAHFNCHWLIRVM